MAEITYRDGAKPLFIEFEEIADLHESVEREPESESEIVVTLNLSSAQTRREEIESEN
jgi:hypothetical protein